MLFLSFALGTKSGKDVSYYHPPCEHPVVCCTQVPMLEVAMEKLVIIALCLLFKECM